MNIQDITWTQHGLLFAATPDQLATLPFAATHASNPTAVSLSNNHLRIFFSVRNPHNQSCIVSIDFDTSGEHYNWQPCSEVALVLSPGTAGLFDDSGATHSCVVAHQGQHWLYYVGWNLGKTVPWRNAIGLAVAQPGQAFQKTSLAPIFDRNAIDPYSLSYPCVIPPNETESLWWMYYGTHTQWGPNISDMRHGIRRAVSTDGLHWQPDVQLCLAPQDEALGPLGREIGLSRPWVIAHQGQYHMWFSYRGDVYRIGHATSKDGITWTRHETALPIAVAQDPSAWNGQAVCYASIFNHNNQLMMLYNGNDFGKTGFGLATLS